MAADKLPSVDIVVTSGDFAAVPAIAVAVTLIVPVIDLGKLEVARLCYCYCDVPLFVALVHAFEVVATSA